MDPETRQEIIPDMDDLVDGMMCIPKPFKASILPRSAYKAQCVRDEWAEASKLLDGDMQWEAVPSGLIWGEGQPQVSD